MVVEFAAVYLMSGRAIILCLLACTLAACVPYRRAPLLPAQQATRIQARSLDDPRLLKFIAAVTHGAPSGTTAQRRVPSSAADASSGTPQSSPTAANEAGASWNLSALTLAAVYF